MDKLEQDYDNHIPQLLEIVPKADITLLKALQHFQGYGGAKLYLKKLKETGSHIEAQKALNDSLTDGGKKPLGQNLTVEEYLNRF